jgi:hypothetical protein
MAHPQVANGQSLKLWIKESARLEDEWSHSPGCDVARSVGVAG